MPISRSAMLRKAQGGRSRINKAVLTRNANFFNSRPLKVSFKGRHGYISRVRFLSPKTPQRRREFDRPLPGKE